ncbi:hypothetical protein SAMN02745866_00055 [Alteromonadaceae bacterium Bs31]|nr:hypothetical protein SAMN02745866_00055 [Alteromonadaceae bacterium Bs31]
MKIFLVLSCMSMLAACSSTNVPKNMLVDFKTRITSSGLKHFQLQIVPNKEAMAERSSNRRRADGDQRRSNPDRLARNNERMLVAQAQELIALNGYCKKGFWLLDKSLYGHAPYIRAECNDTATKEDRAQFPDTLHRW